MSRVGGREQPALVCPFCREVVNLARPGFYRLVTGWVEARQGGGAHAVRLASPDQGYAHRHCIEREVWNRDHPGLIQEELPW